MHMDGRWCGVCFVTLYCLTVILVCPYLRKPSLLPRIHHCDT